MEREILLTGIGGQGVQLASSILARAAIAAGLEAQVFGSYGGMMRGGNTEATVVVGEGPIEAPPTITNGWSAIVVHPEFAAPTLARVFPGGLVLFNQTLVDEAPWPDAIGIPATDLADGSVNTALVMIGAYIGVTGIVALDDALAAVEDALPSYRKQHTASCQQALRTGYDAAPATRVPAWEGAVTR